MSKLTVRIRLPPRRPGPTPGAGPRPPRRPVGQGRPTEARRRSGDRTARLLALAHHIDGLVEEGRIRDYAEAADVLGLTRARLTQVMNLVLLAPDVQARVAMRKCAMSERDLRRVCAEADWSKQVDQVRGEEA